MVKSAERATPVSVSPCTRLDRNGADAFPSAEARDCTPHGLRTSVEPGSGWKVQTGVSEPTSARIFPATVPPQAANRRLGLRPRRERPSSTDLSDESCRSTSSPNFAAMIFASVSTWSSRSRLRDVLGGSGPWPACGSSAFGTYWSRKAAASGGGPGGGVGDRSPRPPRSTSRPRPAARRPGLQLVAQRHPHRVKQVRVVARCAAADRAAGGRSRTADGGQAPRRRCAAPSGRHPSSPPAPVPAATRPIRPISARIRIACWRTDRVCVGWPRTAASRRRAHRAGRAPTSRGPSDRRWSTCRSSRAAASTARRADRVGQPIRREHADRQVRAGQLVDDLRNGLGRQVELLRRGRRRRRSPCRRSARSGRAACRGRGGAGRLRSAR